MRYRILVSPELFVVGIDVVRPSMAETTSLGAAMAAAISIGLWSPEKAANCEDKTDTFQPKMETQIRDAKFKRWTQAIQRSLDWTKN